MPRMHRAGIEVCPILSQPWHYRGVGGQCQAPAALPLGRAPLSIGGGRTGPRSSLDEISISDHNPGHPACSKSIYCLCYPSPFQVPIYYLIKGFIYIYIYLMCNFVYTEICTIQYTAV